MKRRGFTLVELLVVVFVIGILAVLLLPWWASRPRPALRADCSNKIHNLGVAAGLYADNSTNGGLYPENLAPGKTNAALKSLNLLFPQYVNDHRFFACPGLKSPPQLTANIAPASNSPGDANLDATMTGYGYTMHKNPTMSACGLIGDCFGVDRSSTPSTMPLNHKREVTIFVLASGTVEIKEGPQSDFPGDDLFKDDSATIPKEADTYLRNDN